jgi:hypothetical protein
MTKPNARTITHYDLIGAVRALGLKIRCKGGTYRFSLPEHVRVKARPSYFTPDRGDALNAARSMAVELDNEETGTVAKYIVPDAVGSLRRAPASAKRGLKAF